jgi:hypothetical protein
MSKQVNGFLAGDGTFFEHEPECNRYEAMNELQKLCDSHGTNYDNFMVLVNSWHKQIKEYYNADKDCKAQWANGDGNVKFEKGTFDDYDDDGDDIPAFLRTEGDTTDTPVGDKDTPGFLEQQIRGNIGVPNIRDRSHAKAVPTARKGDGT